MSRNDTVFDVAVVGAGPAGASAALAAARRGWTVALIDKSSFPRDKACGDGIGPGAVRTLRRLGAEETVLAGYDPVEAVTLLGPGGRRARSTPRPLDDLETGGYVVPREVFDHRLYLAALAAGATGMTGRKVTGTRERTGVRELVLRTRDGQPATLAAHLVIAADGATSIMRRALTGQGGIDHARAAIALRAYAEARIPGPGLHLEFTAALRPSYGWAFPANGTSVNLGLGGPADLLRRRGIDLRAELDRHADRLRAGGLEIGELDRVKGSYLPHLAGQPRLAHSRAVLLGDAASMINPVSGEGIAYAMTAALALVEALPDRLEHYAVLDAGLAEFERAFRSGHRRHVRTCLIVQRLMRNRALSSMMIDAMGRDPDLFDSVVAMMFEAGSLSGADILRGLTSRVRPLPRSDPRLRQGSRA